VAAESFYSICKELHNLCIETRTEGRAVMRLA